MFRHLKWEVLSLALILALLATTVDARQRSQSLTMASVNDSQWQARGKPSASVLVKLQILLDRAHASPGVIDGNQGENTRKAITAFGEMKRLESTEQADEQLWRMLIESDSEAVLVTYNITDKDIAGPFPKKIPEDFRKKAAMERLGYTSPEELLAEKFHMSQDLLRKLNPGASFDKAEQEIVVADVEHESLPGKISRIEVDADAQRVKAYDKDNNIVVIYPATVGSEDRPTPKGEFKVTDIAENPVYHYDPALHLRGVHVEEKLDISPGPNNPVGAVWISLSAEGYGIHGTPDPDKISKAASHGCIRLTNWDALELARHLSKGTPVVIEEGEKTGELLAPNQGQQMGPSLAATDATPLPDRNPARAGAPAQQTPPPPEEVATLPWTETEIAVAKAECAEALSSATLDYEPLPPLREGLCGAPAPILLKTLGAEPKVAIDPPATVTCALAKALSAWINETVQPKAKALFNSPVVKLHAASYACRNRNGGADQPLSEHALANAIDISDFVLSSGEQIAVVENWPKGPASPPLPLPNPGRVSSETFKVQRVSDPGDGEREFLQSVHDEACKTFGTVLGPNADEAHKNHFHVDMKQRRGAGFCQ
jgi:peptidoglycan hydrolase-like protein with peptidoglycan-binding domain